MYKLLKKLMAVFAAAVTAVSVSDIKTFAADSESARAAAAEDIAGIWYDIGSRTEAVYRFGRDGSVSITDMYERETGTYTFDKGLITFTLTSDDPISGHYLGENYRRACAAAFYGDSLMIKYFTPNAAGGEKLDTSEFSAYNEGEDIWEYFDNIGTSISPRMLSREKPVRAEQEMVRGVWSAKEFGRSGITNEGICIFEENSSTAISGREGEAMSLPMIFKDGSMEAVGEMPDNISTDESERWYLCGGRLIIDYGFYSYTVMERYVPRKITDEELDRAAAYSDNEELLFFYKGKLYCIDSFESESYEGKAYTLDDYTVTLPLNGNEVTFDYYVTDSMLFLVSGEDVIVFEFNAMKGYEENYDVTGILH